MAKRNQGTKNMSDEQNAQPDPAKGAQAAANEFAPTIINDGGEDGAREVAPAKLDERGNEPGANAPDDSAEAAAAAGLEATAEDEAAEAEARARSQEKRERDAERQREFVDYVNGDLKLIADEFGYDLKLTKRGAPNTGPIMLYDPATREGKVYNSRAEAPSHFLTGDQLNAIREEERAAGLDPK